MSVAEVVVTIAVCAAILLGLFVLAIRDAGGFGRLLLAERTHGAIFGWWILLVVAVLPIVIAIHELGHVLAGALMGMRFSFVQVGPVALLRTPKGLRLRWNHPLPDDVLGLQSSVPEGERVSVARLVAHAFGGAALNLVTAALAWRVMAAVGPARSTAGAAFLDILRVVLVLSALGMLNLVPFRTPRGRLTDGGMIRYYVRRGGTALAALLRVAQGYACAQRPREWGVDAADLAKWAESDQLHGSRLLLLALGVALDRGDQGLAREILGRAGEVVEPLTRAEFVLQAALLDSLDGDPVRARARLEAVGQHPWNADYPALAEAAVLLGEGRAREASEALQRWDRLVASSPPALRVGNEWAEEAIRRRLACGATRLM